MVFEVRFCRYEWVNPEKSWENFLGGEQSKRKWVGTGQSVVSEALSEVAEEWRRNRQASHGNQFKFYSITWEQEGGDLDFLKTLLWLLCREWTAAGHQRDSGGTLEGVCSKSQGEGWWQPGLGWGQRRQRKIERFKIYFGDRAEETSNGEDSRIISRLLLTPWIDNFKQIIHGKLLTVKIGNMKVRSMSLAARSDPVCGVRYGHNDMIRSMVSQTHLFVDKSYLCSVKRTQKYVGECESGAPNMYIWTIAWSKIETIL